MNKIKIADKVDNITYMVNEGRTTQEIAEHLQSNAAAVRYWLKKLKLNVKPAKNALHEHQKIAVLELYPKYKDALLVAKLVNSTQHLVLKFLKEQGVDTSSRKFKEKDAEIVMSKYKDGMTIDEIADFYNCDRQAVQSLFKRKGFNTRSQLEQKQITWNINQNAFTDWSNEADLFFYGLLLTDGSISSDNRISISLQYQDMSIVEELKNYIGSNNKLHILKPGSKRKSGIVSFSFADKIVANNLRNAGMLENKSTKEVPPTFDISNPEIARHFWRGCICGDGSVRSYKSNNTDRKIPILHLCGSFDLCNEFKQFVEVVFGRSLIQTPRRYIDKRHDRGSDLHYIKFSGLVAKTVALYMFENAKFSIKRKTDDVMKFKEYHPMIDRWK